jgi:hypothetical protein
MANLNLIKIISKSAAGESARTIRKESKNVSLNLYIFDLEQKMSAFTSMQEIAGKKE